MYKSKGEEKEIYTVSNPEDLGIQEKDPNYLAPYADELTEIDNRPKRKYSAAFSEEHFTHDHWVIDIPTQEIVQKYEQALYAENFNDFIQYVKSDIKDKMKASVVQILLEHSSKSDERAQGFAYGLIELLHSSKVINKRNIRRGFDKVYRNMYELVRENEQTLEVIAEQLEACISGEILGADAIMRMPLKFFEAANGSMILQGIDEGSLVECISAINKVKDEINNLLDDFFASENSTDLDEFLARSNNKYYAPLLIRKCIERALDRSGSHKELCARYIGTIQATHDDFISAFDDVIWNIPELAVDVPGVERQLGVFIARSVIDDRLPVSYVRDAIVMTSVEVKALESANAMLRSQNAPEYINSQFATHTTEVDELKKLISEAVAEFFSSRDKENAIQCLEQLNCPHFLHEFVKRGIELAMDKTQREEELLCEFIKELVDSQFLDRTQVKQGVSRVRQKLPELLIDVPNAETILSRFEEKLEGLTKQ